jgi:Ca2+-binding RTX toxin-like protein
MVNIRFTSGGDYDPANSYSNFSDPYFGGGITITRNNGNGFFRVDATNGSGDYVRSGSNVYAYWASDALYVDASSASFLRAEGGNRADVFVGSAFADRLDGSYGDDTLAGNDGDDVLIGGGGADNLDGGNGMDGVSYETSGAAVVVSLANPSFNTGDALGDTYFSIENLRGGSGDDTLTGDAGDNVLEGGTGADAFDGGHGYDVVTYAHASQRVIVGIAGFGSGDDADGDTYTNVEALTGSAYDDIFFLLGSFTVEGGAGADQIVGIDGLLTLSYANSGEAVTVDLASGTASGGDAEGDTLGVSFAGLIGSTHADTLIGGTATSYISGNGGLDTITGGAGNDTITVPGTWASIDGGAGTDRLIFRNPDALQTTQPAAGALINVEKVIVGEGGLLDLSQQSAIDGSIKLVSKADGMASAFGTAFGDTIRGGDGNDQILGGGGRDHLSGGAGADLFGYILDTQFDTTRDVIRDFSGHNGEGDKIAVLSLAPVSFVDRFSGDGDIEIRAVARGGGFQVVLMDLDGDGKSDASIRVSGKEALTADDFLLVGQAGGEAAHTDAFSPQPYFFEALQPHDITALI